MKSTRLTAPIFLCGILILCSSTTVHPQQPELPSNTWETRAQNLTESLVADAAHLSRSNKALLWVRLGQVWLKDDPERARTWFTRAVETLEPSATEKSDAICRRASARILFGLIASRDRALANRLIAIFDEGKNDQDEKERLETANALATAAINVVDTNPKAAAAFAEDSLKIEISWHIGQILWRLQKRDPEAGDKLFLKILEIARAKSDSSLFSMLSMSVLHGPFSTDRYKRIVVRSIADMIAQLDRMENSEVAFCKGIPVLPALLPEFDRLLPEFSPRIRDHIVRCQIARGEDSKSAQKSSEVNAPPSSVEDFLRLASNTRNQFDRTRYLIDAANLAGQKKDYDRAVSILDSMEQADKELALEMWESCRWDFAAAAACAHRKNDNLQSMNKVIDDTPPKLRGFVRIALASTCEAATGQAERMSLIEPARKDLERADPSEQPLWYLSLVRVYAKLSLNTAPEMFSQAVAAINRLPGERKDECPTTFNLTVLGHQLLLDRYQIPATLLDADEPGILNTIRSVQPSDVRAALRLQLLAATLEQRLTSKKTIPVRRSP